MIEKLLIWSLPVLLTGLLTSIITRRHKAQERLNTAKDALRAAFNPTLAQLDLARKHKSTHEAPDIDGQLIAALFIQAEAIKAYDFFVPQNKKEEYKKAWNDYYSTAKGGTFIEGFVGNADPIGVIENKINTILKFTKDK